MSILPSKSFIRSELHKAKDIQDVSSFYLLISNRKISDLLSCNFACILGVLDMICMKGTRNYRWITGIRISALLIGPTPCNPIVWPVQPEETISLKESSSP
jgi:hypothetical protein